MKITFGNVTVEGDQPEAELVNQAAVAWLSQQFETPSQAQIDEVVAGYYAAQQVLVAQSEAEVWFDANAGALGLLNLPMATLEGEVAALVDVLVPSATAANRTKLKRLLMAGAVLDRSQVKNSGLG